MCRRPGIRTSARGGRAIAASDTAVRVSLTAEQDAVHATVEETGPPAQARDHVLDGGGQGLHA